MMKRDSFLPGSLKSRKIAFIVFAIGLMTIVPFYFGEQTEAQTSPGTFLAANMTGAPIGQLTPRGSGRYFSDSTNRRILDVEVSNVNLPFRTVLEVRIGGNSVGTFQVSSTRTGRLHIETPMQPVPTVEPGAGIEIKRGSDVILSGTFSAPQTPSPSPTRTPFPSPSGTPTGSPTPRPTPSAALFAPLSGETIDGIMPRGMGQYIEFGTVRNLNVFVSRVRIAEGTTLSVLIGDAAVGQITLNADGSGGLRLSTANGGTVPTVTAGTTVTVKNGSATVLSGAFRAFTQPSPSPTVTPTGTPTPHPSPRPNRVFGGRMNGAQVVPAVTTNARGGVSIVLNEAETQIKIFAGFVGLSSAQTSATINGPAQTGETAEAIFTIPAIGGTSGRFPVATFDVTAEQVEQLRNGLWYMQIGSTDNPNGEIRGQIRSRTRPSGFTGAETEDIAVYRPNNQTWYVSTNGGLTARTLGAPGSIPVSGDFDGDGSTDYAAFRNGTWTISRSSDGGLTVKQFGTFGDLPVRGDYDGDGTLDLSVFRPSNGTWYIQKSSGGLTVTQFGANGDRPTASDIDGDGRTDITVFRPSNGTWYWLRSSTGAFGAVQFGQNGDVPVAGDFDGDGADDITVYRGSTGAWYSLQSSDGAFRAYTWGMNGDIPVPGNYDGDMIADVAVYRPSNGTWYIYRSSDNTIDFRYFGTNGDIPTTGY